MHWYYWSKTKTFIIFEKIFPTWSLSPLLRGTYYEIKLYGTFLAKIRSFIFTRTTWTKNYEKQYPVINPRFLDKPVQKGFFPSKQKISFRTCILIDIHKDAESHVFPGQRRGCVERFEGKGKILRRKIRKFPHFWEQQMALETFI